MSAIRGKGNKSTELRLVNLLRKSDLVGWRRHPDYLTGRPDFVFKKVKVAIFVDGCFWHGCREIKKPPANNHEFWLRKIEANRQRDIIVTKRLRKEGWKVIRVWEHQLKKNPDTVLSKISKVV
jgi:DNA mismatch endonuclease (patch repair protein)